MKTKNAISVAEPADHARVSASSVTLGTVFSERPQRADAEKGVEK